MAEQIELHSEVRELTTSFVATKDGIGLSYEALQSWLVRLRSRADHLSIGVSLLACAKAFSKHERMRFAATELIGLAVAILGTKEVFRTIANDSGSESARALIDAAPTFPPITPPAPSKSDGVGVRRPQFKASKNKRNKNE